MSKEEIALKETLKNDKKFKVGLTEKMTFELCASLIAYEVNHIISGNLLKRGTMPATGKDAAQK